MYYLLSRGINKKDAKILLIQATLLNKMLDDFKEQMLLEINCLLEERGDNYE